MTFPSNLKKTAGILGALTIVGGTAWTAADYTEVRPVMKREFLQMAQIQSEIIKNLQETQSKIIETQDAIDFRQLMWQQSVAPLSLADKHRLCDLAAQFHMMQAAGC
jgi:hypothetical protein